jgi:tetratricopeptide (TPR) repeat protein
MPEPLTIAGTAIAGTRLGFQVCKEVKKVCRWLTGNLDSVGRFSRADSLSPGELVARYHEYYIDNIQSQMELDGALAKLHSTEKRTKWFTCTKKSVKSKPIAVKLLFTGMPKMGKTRAVYEKVIKGLPDFLVFMPSPVELGKVRSTELHLMPSKRGLILFLDDVDQFVVRQDIDLKYLINRLQCACPRLLVVATLRTGVDMTDKVMAERHGRDLLHDFLKINFRDITEDEANKLAQETLGLPHYKEFDGKTPGSVILGLEEMRRRLERLGLDEKPPNTELNKNARALCRTLKLLYCAFLSGPKKELIKTVSDKVFSTNFQNQRIAWDDCIKKLSENDFIKDVGEFIIAPHSDYLSSVYELNYDPTGDLDKLKDIFIDEGNVPALVNMGVALQVQRKYGEALQCYDKALALDSKFLPAWYNKGNILKESGNHKEAIDCYNEVLKIDPNFVPALLNKGIILSELGEPDKAIECYDKRLEIEPNCFFAWYNKGNALLRLGKRDEALECYNKALEIEPSFSPARHNKDQLEKLKGQKSV